MAKIKNWTRRSKDKTGTSWRHDETNDLVMVKKIPSNPDDISFGTVMSTPKNEEDALRKNWILQKPTHNIPDSNRQRTGYDTREQARKAAVRWMNKHTNLVEIRARNSKTYREMLKKNDPEKYREIFG